MEHSNDKQVPSTNMVRLGRAVALGNHLIVTPLVVYYAIFPLAQMRGMNMSLEWPDLTTTITQIIGCLLIEVGMVLDNRCIVSTRIYLGELTHISIF